MLIGRVLQMYTMYPAVGDIAYSRSPYSLISGQLIGRVLQMYTMYPAVGDKAYSRSLYSLISGTTYFTLPILFLKEISPRTPLKRA